MIHGVLKGNFCLWREDGRMCGRTPYISKTNYWIQANSSNTDHLKPFFFRTFQQKHEEVAKHSDLILKEVEQAQILFAFADSEKRGIKAEEHETTTKLPLKWGPARDTSALLLPLAVPGSAKVFSWCMPECAAHGCKLPCPKWHLVAKKSITPPLEPWTSCRNREQS